MVNERKTENLVRNLLAKHGYTNNDNVVIEEQQSDNPKINKLLKLASKSGKGKGFPEFIITFKDNPENIVIIECKASPSKHESIDRKQYKDFAVDGALLYASFLKDHFNVMAIAVSGEIEREITVSHYLWLKGKHTYKDVTDKHLLNPKSLFHVIKEQSAPIREEELIRKAIEYNEELHSYSIPEVERCTLVSSILVALQDKAFHDSYKSHHAYDEAEEEAKDYNPNESLIDDMISACERVLKRNGISIDKRKTIIGEYNKIKQNHTFGSKRVHSKGVSRKNTILRDLIHDLNENVMPYVNSDVFDVLGQFYTQFIRYAGSDSKTGLVLTPPHITNFFCEVADINENDIVFDPCCGTGGFLVSAMKQMLKKAGGNLNKQKGIKTSQLVGIEKRADMFSHACSNMMMRGDGKSNIHFGDCFDGQLKKVVNKNPASKVFLNPPYDVGEDGQLEFIENAMDCLVPGGICMAICQMSTVVSSKKATVAVRKRLLKKHTLEAVFSMPDDLFHPIGVITCIIVFKAHAQHPKNKETFFGYFKDDGFMKVKHKGRIDQKNKWPAIKQKWLDTFANRKTVAGLSVMQKVTAENEWCAEAYMETDYSNLSSDDFVDTIKNYVAYQFLHSAAR